MARRRGQGEPYVLTEEDKRVFEASRSNVNVFTDYYFRNEHTGTMFGPDETDLKRKQFYRYLYEEWHRAGSPDDLLMARSMWDWHFGTELVPYKVLFYDDSGKPTFFHNHGLILTPWQVEFFHSTQPEVTIIGGFGCGKTLALVAYFLVKAATLYDYRALVLTPRGRQSSDSGEIAEALIADTPYFERFVEEAGMLRRHDDRRIRVRNDRVGESIISFVPARSDLTKLRTIEVDAVVVDQAEGFDDIEEAEREMGSRARGRAGARPREGRVIFFANSAENPGLWRRFDKAEDDPETYYSRTVTSYDNPYLTDRDFDNLMRRVGTTRGDQEQWILAKRPIGKGHFFTQAMIARCVDGDLDKAMQSALEAKMPGFILEGNESARIFHWEMPPEPNRYYLVAGDPGLAEPPKRNSPVIIVWDYTNFPDEPATLRAFHWIYSDGLYGPFISEFKRYMAWGNATGIFDTTGPQQAINELTFAADGLNVEGVSLAGNTKNESLSSLRFLMDHGLIRFPDIPMLVFQLTRYRLPDRKIAQDIVSAMIVAAYWLKRLFWMHNDSEISEVAWHELAEPREFSRYERAQHDRYSRKQARWRTA